MFLILLLCQIRRDFRFQHSATNQTLAIRFSLSLSRKYIVWLEIFGYLASSVELVSVCA